MSGLRTYLCQVVCSSQVMQLMHTCKPLTHLSLAKPSFSCLRYCHLHRASPDEVTVARRCKGKGIGSAGSSAAPQAMEVCIPQMFSGRDLSPPVELQGLPLREIAHSVEEPLSPTVFPRNEAGP